MSKRTLLLGGLAVAAVAGALKNRDRVAGLLGVRTGEAEPPPPDSTRYAPPEQTRTPVPDEPAPPPAPSNYDIAGPAANTATAVPAPEPLVHDEGGIDEAAEEAAAAAEAAAIGGETPDYAGPALGEAAEEEDRAVLESGGGDAEGQEQAEADLQDNAEPAAGDPIEGGRRIEGAIEAADDPALGEDIEGAVNEPPRAETAGLSGNPEERGTPAPSATSGQTSAYTSPEGEALEDAPTGAADPGRRAEGTTGAGNPPGVHDEGSEAGDPGGDQGTFFAGGKGQEDPEEGPAPGLPDQEAAQAAREHAGQSPGDQGADPAPETETPAEKKSSAVWEAQQKDDEGEWQTWSGRASDS